MSSVYSGIAADDDNNKNKLLYTRSQPNASETVGSITTATRSSNGSSSLESSVWNRLLSSESIWDSLNVVDNDDGGAPTTTHDAPTKNNADNSHEDNTDNNIIIGYHRPTNTRELSAKVAEASNRSRVRRLSSKLTRLNLADTQLHGRDDDMNLLKSKLREQFPKNNGKDTQDVANDNMEKTPHRSEMLLVAGVSGTGKSALVKKGLEEPAQKMGIAFAGGKFDINKSSSLPLSAFSAAMTSLTEQVMDSNKAQIIHGEIKSTLKKHDMMRLINVMPGCWELFTIGGGGNQSLDADDASVNSDLSEIAVELSLSIPSTAAARGRSSSFSLPINMHEAYGRLPSHGGREAVQRLQYAIRTLLKVICTHLKGVVLFIDDLQWSDVATIELLKSIATDKDITSLLLVGAYREDEVSNSHPLMLQMNDKINGIEITTITTSNLSLGNVKSLVAESLRMEGNEDAVSTLATTIHKKCDGNALYVLVFLNSLYDEHLLQYNFGLMKWMWDDDAVNEKLVTENVTTIMINKLKRLEKSSQMVLQVASCLGASFTTSTVEMIVAGRPSTESEPASGGEQSDTISIVSKLIDDLVDEGILEKEGGSTTQHRFVHDQIQYAAFELIPHQRRDYFRGEIGDILMKKMRPRELDDHLFTVVGLRNYAIATMSEEERGELARMNLQAGFKASRNATFDTAVVYYRMGRFLLGADGWEKDGKTMLQLCGRESNACFVNGDLVTMKKLIDEVIGRDLSIEDKFKAYEVKILAATVASRHAEAVDTAIEVRKQLGLRTPPNRPASKLTIAKEFIKTNNLLGKRTPEDIVGLPALKDERIIMGQRMCELLVTSAYPSQPTMFPLIAFLMVRESLKHGINASSCFAFQCYAVILCSLGKFARGRSLGEATELLLENPDYGRMKSRTIFIFEYFIYHWSSPVQATLAPLLAGYQTGLEIGDVESAAFNLANRGIHLWYSGRPLRGLLYELETNMAVLRQLNQPKLQMGMGPCLLAVKQLRGVPISGDDEISFDAILRYASETNDKTIQAFTKAIQLQVFVLLQDWDSAVDLLETAGNVYEAMVGLFASVHFTVTRALVYLKAAQVAKSWLVRRKWKRRATKSMKIVCKWLKNGNVNVVHAMHLLSAELAALKGEKVNAEEQFKLAISASTKNGFLQDKGLTHELTGRYYAAQGDISWATYHLDLAERSFTDWGATAKVEQFRMQKRVLLGE